MTNISDDNLIIQRLDSMDQQTNESIYFRLNQDKRHKIRGGRSSANTSIVVSALGDKISKIYFTLIKGIQGVTLLIETI